jgi:Fic family protein
MAKRAKKKTAPRIPDDGESVTMMMPALLSDEAKTKAKLNDLAVELVARSAGFKRSLPEGTLTALAELVRLMNCYYSNLIEGNPTHPIAIERAMRKNYDADPKKRDLQKEAEAHVVVQRWLDGGALPGGRSMTIDGLREVHHRFCAALPDDLLWVKVPNSDKRIRIVPGEFRDDKVEVGEHVPVSPGAVPRFMREFEGIYTKLGKADAVVNAAAAHHRLLWIHPFLDGNGRVARLMSHAMFLDRLDTGAIWSVARGLGRNSQRYKDHLHNCDLGRRNDLDGRGNLSEESLTAFSEFFLKVCIDQVDFMEKLMQPDVLRTRILSWAEDESRVGALPARAGQILEAVLYRGELPRGDIPRLLQLTDRQALRIVNALADRHVLTSRSSKAPWQLMFPATLAHRWMPDLFPPEAPAAAARP